MSRRIKNNLKSIWVLVITALLLSSPFMTGFAAAKVIEKTQAKGAIISHEKLSESDKIITLFKSSMNIDDESIVWDEAEIFTYKDLEIKGVVIQTKNPYIKYAAYYNPQKDSFTQFYMKSELKYNKENPSKTLEGSFSYFDSSGRLMSKADYAQGKLVNITETNEKNIQKNDLSVSMSCNWTCVQNCVKNIFSQLPRWLQLLCDAGCGACIFGGNPYACSVCLGCLIGYGWSYCYDQCCY